MDLPSGQLLNRGVQPSVTPTKHPIRCGTESMEVSCTQPLSVVGDGV